MNWSLLSCEYFLLCFLLTVGFLTSKLHHQQWQDEIERSIQRNIKFCPNQYVDPTNGSVVLQAEGFLTKRIFPSKYELRPFQDLPITLTKAHMDLAKAASLRRYNYHEWGNESESRWEIPANHPGQDRRNCINMTQLASTDGKIYSFYESFRSVDRAFYITIVRQGFIHPSGAVMASCGYYMGEELCENRWDYAKDWHQKCKDFMKKKKYGWSTFFEGSEKLPMASWNELVENCADNTDLGKPAHQKKFTVSRANKVFVIPALWDYNYHHFMADSLARLARHYDFLKKHTDIKIHLRFFEEYDPMRRNNKGVKAQAWKMRETILSFLGFNTSRIITGPVLAKEVYIPRALRCSYALSNPMEIRLLARHFLTNLRYFLKVRYPSVLKQISASYYSRRPLPSSIEKIDKGHRHKGHHNRGSKKGQQQQLQQVTRRLQLGSHRNYTRGSFLASLPDEIIENSSLYWPSTISAEFIEKNKLKTRYMVILQRFRPYSDDRNWDDTTFSKIILAFAQAFPSHGIFPLSSKRYDEENYCFACDLLLMTQSEILVGAHGAGLTNMMFFPANSLVVEIVGQPMDVNMPVCGYYGPYAAIFGHHHYLYAFLNEQGWPLLAQQAADEASSFFQFIQYRTSDDQIIRVYNSTNYGQCRP